MRELFFLEATAFAKLFVREPGTDALIRLLESVEDNRKLISAATPLEVYAAIRRRERSGQSLRKLPPRRLNCCALRPGEWSAAPESRCA